MKRDPQINIRLPQELKDKVHALAEYNKRSVNAEIVKAIEIALSRHESEQRTKDTYGQYTADVVITDPNRLLYTIQKTRESGEKIDESVLENMVKAIVTNAKALEAAFSEIKNEKK